MSVIGRFMPAPFVPTKVRVLIGDTLESLAYRNLGSPVRWVEIWDLNRPKIKAAQEARGVKDGEDFEIFPGMELDMPRISRDR